ncbi:MAG: protein kinase [Planctomycetia bacterium]|nr:protein kinase [Planctomycetia bacterium]
MILESDLLFGVLACSANLIDSKALMEMIRDWKHDRNISFAELLTERAKIKPTERDRLDSLVNDRLAASEGIEADALSKALDELKQFIGITEAAQVQSAISTFLGDQFTMMHTPAKTGSSSLVSASTQAAPIIQARPVLQMKGPLPGSERYTRTSLHASGGMGSVWHAHDANIGRDVALKELKPEYKTAGTVPLRFLREARITGQLEHPGIVPVYDIGTDPETSFPYYTMRFVKGRTLSEAIQTYHQKKQTGKEEPLEFVSLLSAFVSLCHTIAYAHSKGIVHRDLKGENIILGDFGEVIVLDWGLAKRMGQQEDDFEMISYSDQRVNLTEASKTIMGEVMGTPAYMAPEQANGRLDIVGPRTDIFGAGAILYEILTGFPPFTGATTVATLKKAQQADIIRPRMYQKEISPALEAICMKALEKDPQNRYTTASELALEVQGWQDAQRRKAELELRQAGERLMKQQAVLVELTRSEVFASNDLQRIYHRMIEASAHTLGVERVSVWRYTEDRQAIVCHLLYERSTGKTSSGVELRAADFPSYFKALTNSEVIPAHDAHTDPSTREFSQSYLTPLNIGAIMDAPLHIGGKMEGVVCHEHVGSSRHWTPDEQLFAIAIANLVSQAISHAERG